MKFKNIGIIVLILGFLFAIAYFVRTNSVITIFIGAGLFMLGWIAIGEPLKGVGALVGLIGVGQMVAGYIYPNQSEEINKAVEEYEKK